MLLLAHRPGGIYPPSCSALPLPLERGGGADTGRGFTVCPRRMEFVVKVVGVDACMPEKSQAVGSLPWDGLRVGASGTAGQGRCWGRCWAGRSSHCPRAGMVWYRLQGWMTPQGRSHPHLLGDARALRGEAAGPGMAGEWLGECRPPPALGPGLGAGAGGGELGGGGCAACQ